MSCGLLTLLHYFLPYRGGGLSEPSPKESRSQRGLEEPGLRSKGSRGVTRLRHKASRRFDLRKLVLGNRRGRD